MLQIKHLRNANHKEKIIHAKSSASIAKSCLNEPAIYGSLPNRSFLDSMSKELESSLPAKMEPYRAQRLTTTQDVIAKARNSKKIVRFADSFGLDLENVKIISNNSFADLLTPLETNEDTEETQVTSQPFLVLIPLFSLRKHDKIQKNIRLEDYVYDYENKMIRCMIKVRNITFKKRVFARVSLNNWSSFHDLNAVYVKSENQKEKMGNQSFQNCSFDFFGFCLIIPDRSVSKESGEDERIDTRIEFALCYEGADFESYWDNNDGQNYKFQCFFNKRS